MSFHFLGKVVQHAWHFLLAAWILLLFGTWYAAPKWDEVAQSREFSFLPPDAPTRRAEALYAEAFPDEPLGSSVVLIVKRTDNDSNHRAEVLRFVDDHLEPGLRQIAASDGGLAGDHGPSEEPLFGDEPAEKKPAKRSIIERIRTPNAPGAGALLISADSKAMLVVVELTTEFLSRDNWPTIAKIEELVVDLQAQGKVPAGAELYVTGSAVVGRDHTEAEIQSARSTEVLSIALVVLLLVGIYRAPLVAIIPLATVFVAVQIAKYVLAILGGAGYITLFRGIEIYITILGYGAGVDYCLFLTARYQEELAQNPDSGEAVAKSVSSVGSTLVASAATVICGIGMMIFAEFGKFREAGWAIPLSIFLVLCATLTFTPALLRMAGHWAFWPQKPSLWALVGGEAHRVDGRRSLWERVGHWLIHRPGTVWLVTLALMTPFSVAGVFLRDRLSYDLVGNLPAGSPSVAGTRALQEHFPAGVVGPVTVLLVNRGVDFGNQEGEALIKDLTERLREKTKELGVADIRSLTQPLGAVGKNLALPGNPNVDVETRREAFHQAAVDYYLTDLGGRKKTGTRLVLVLEDAPFSHRSVDTIGQIEAAVQDALPGQLREGSRLEFVGPTASVRDLADVRQRDQVRIQKLVLAGVFVILVVLLRDFVVSVYLLLSVLLSYYCTLGACYLVFWMLDPAGFAGVDWKVAVFLFTILIAVGEDYNIFLLTRVREETKRHGPIRGVTAALARTGPVISSCGIIMAGTFASLLAGSLAEMKQLGFALAFGVLLDTFVVRPILVPAFLVLMAEGRFWPANWLRPRRPDSRAIRELDGFC